MWSIKLTNIKLFYINVILVKFLHKWGGLKWKFVQLKAQITM